LQHNLSIQVIDCYKLAIGRNRDGIEGVKAYVLWRDRPGGPAIYVLYVVAEAMARFVPHEHNLFTIRCPRRALAVDSIVSDLPRFASSSRQQYQLRRRLERPQDRGPLAIGRQGQRIAASEANGVGAVSGAHIRHVIFSAPVRVPTLRKQESFAIAGNVADLREVVPVEINLLGTSFGLIIAVVPSD
jgi:hypothetical protein